MRNKMILLDDWNFDFEKEIVEKAFLLFDIGVNPTKVAKRLKLKMQDVMIIMLDWSDKRGKWA